MKFTTWLMWLALMVVSAAETLYSVIEHEMLFSMCGPSATVVIICFTALCTGFCGHKTFSGIES